MNITCTSDELRAIAFETLEEGKFLDDDEKGLVFTHFASFISKIESQCEAQKTRYYSGGNEVEM